MNIYEKLQNVRVELAAEGLRKSGNNSYNKFSYFELSDFLPQANRLCKEFRLGHVTTINEDLNQITLSVIDLDEIESRIEFRLPLHTVNLKANHDIQNLGATITYSRRYLYMLAFDVVQSDSIESRNPDKRIVEFVPDPDAPPKDELQRLRALFNRDPEDFPEFVKKFAEKKGKPIDDNLYGEMLSETIARLKSEIAGGKHKGYKVYSLEDIAQFS